MTVAKRDSPRSHLKWDVEHGFIEIIPSRDRTPPPATFGASLSLYHPNDTIRLLVTENPKKVGSKAWQIFKLYAEGMTVGEFEKKHGTYEFLTVFDQDEPFRYGPSLTNELLPGLPGHSHWAQRVREIIGAHVADLGGLSELSEAEKSILRRASVLTISCERLERRFSVSPVDHIARDDLTLYTKLANSLRRLLDMTGLERRGPRTIVPSIDDYVAARANDDPDPTIDVPDPKGMSEAAE